MTTYCFDLDGTLCLTKGREYQDAKPFPERIAKVNALFDQGHRILIDSARGSLSGRDWEDLTLAQLGMWGVKYHDLRTGVKWFADVYVDDRAVGLSGFFS